MSLLNLNPGDLVTVRVRRHSDYSGEHREWAEILEGSFISLTEPSSPAENDAPDAATADLLKRLDDWAPGLTAVRKDCLEAAAVIRNLLKEIKSLKEEHSLDYYEIRDQVDRDDAMRDRHDE